MSNQQALFALLARLGASRHKIVVDRTLCEFMGSLEGAIFLSQLLYWSDRGKGDWFYKKHDEWTEETFLNKYQIRHAIKRCQELGFLEFKLRKANGAPTGHYRLDFEKFTEAILQFLEMDFSKSQNPFSENEQSIVPNQTMESAKSDDPITEITTEITTEREGEREHAPARTTPRISSPHLDPRKFRDGRIPPGTGSSAIEVYYERFSIHDAEARLNAPEQDDLVRLCPDLERLREVIIAYSRNNYRPGNVQLILDWYREGVPERHRGANRANGNNATGSGLDVFKEYARKHGVPL